jgi:hypothetical protein
MQHICFRVGLKWNCSSRTTSPMQTQKATMGRRKLARLNTIAANGQNLKMQPSHGLLSIQQAAEWGKVAHPCGHPLQEAELDLVENVPGAQGRHSVGPPVTLER